MVLYEYNLVLKKVLDENFQNYENSITDQKCIEAGFIFNFIIISKAQFFEKLRSEKF